MYSLNTYITNKIYNNISNNYRKFIPPIKYSLSSIF